MARSAPPAPGLHGAVRLDSYTVVYGGSFDPPHLGHQLACVYLLEALGAQTVWLVPAYTHAFDKPLSSFEDRLAMCSRMAEFVGERVRIDPIEKELNAGGKTLLLLEALIERHPERSFALAVGADIVGERHRWYRWDEIEARIPVVVVGRAGYDEAIAPALELPEVSSTEVRERVRDGRSLTGLVPTAVADYIAARGLYREANP
ncbi:MAG: nicotinate (nicotinamide) nucleotide adenylyltransferase [Myxococcota bacterium]